MGKVNPIPEGHDSATPYLCIKGAARAIDFYKNAFGATEETRMADPQTGAIGHAEIRIGSALIMLADEYPDMQFLSPDSIGGTPVMIYVYVPDVDATCASARQAGATIINEPKTQFYGDRSCKLRDPFGHCWVIATHVEDVEPAEIERRAKEMYSQAGA